MRVARRRPSAKLPAPTAKRAIGDLHISLAGRTNLAGEIYAQLVEAISTGRLKPGDRLPPTREFATRLGVSRTTVAFAYDRLTGEDLLTSRVGSGTFVSQSASPTVQHDAMHASPLQPREIWADVSVRHEHALVERQVEFDFRPGIPDVRFFPHDRWRRLVSSQWRATCHAVGVYGDPAGYDGLRMAVARHIGVARGVRASAGEIVITNGTQQALDIIAGVLLRPGDCVALEDPGYPPAWDLFKAQGAAVSAVPVDQDGLVVEAIPDQARLVYVSPSHQFPLGVSMSTARRSSLLEWAEVHNAAIVEDDYDSELRFGGRPPDPLQTLDKNGRVIFVGSFSATMLPSLRLGFVKVPGSLIEPLQAAKYVADRHSATATQVALARFIDEGWFAHHLRKMRTVYQRRHAKIMHAMTTEFAQHLDPIPSITGLHICAIARHASTQELGAGLDRAAMAGVDVAPLARYCMSGKPVAGLVIGCGAIHDERIEEGMLKLSRSLFGKARVN